MVWTVGQTALCQGASVLWTRTPCWTCLCRQLWKNGRRQQSTFPQTMKAWQLYEYGSTDKLTMSTTARVPPILKPTDVLVKIHAASINRIDTARLGGYGATTLNLIRQVRNSTGENLEFPLTLGRDFSGTVVGLGRRSVANKLAVGDEVFGVVQPHVNKGSHAEYVVTEANLIAKKPACLSHVEAASLPYIAMTVWAAISTAAGLNERTARGKRVLINGGAGGLGTYTIQLLKAWGCDVTTTASTDAVEMLVNLGADTVIDYYMYDVKQELAAMDRFDIILDCVADDYDKLSPYLKPSGMPFESKYITLTPPLLRNNDSLGLPLGLAKTLFSFAKGLTKTATNLRGYYWGFFIPNKEALITTGKLAEKKKILPVVERVFSFEHLPQAYDKVLQGHARGKTVIDVIGSQEQHPSDRN